MLTIVADQNMPAVADLFANVGTVRLVPGRDITRADLADADILLVRSVTPVNEALLAGTPVKLVGSATSGLDHIDHAYLDAAGIPCVAAHGANANSVVEYVLAAIAECADYLERLLSGGRVGIVGCGAVGRLLTQRLAALGIAYRVYDPWLAPGDVPCGTTLDEVFDCDVVTLHTALTDEKPWPSRHLVAAQELRSIRPRALLVNASRGAVLDNQALKTQLLASAGPVTVLDVWESEPGIDAQLLQHVAIGTAHIAGYSFDAKLRATQMLREACTRLLELPDAAPGGLPALPVITLEQGLGAAHTIRALLRERYAIRHDDALLREALATALPAARGAAFDALRRDYRVRRELAGSRVTGAGLDTAQRRRQCCGPHPG